MQIGECEPVRGPAVHLKPDPMTSLWKPDDTSAPSVAASIKKGSSAQQNYLMCLWMCVWASSKQAGVFVGFRQIVLLFSGSNSSVFNHHFLLFMPLATCRPLKRNTPCFCWCKVKRTGTSLRLALKQMLHPLVDTHSVLSHTPKFLANLLAVTARCQAAVW